LKRDDRVYTWIVPDCTKATLQVVILGKHDRRLFFSTQLPVPLSCSFHPDTLNLSAVLRLVVERAHGN